MRTAIIAVALTALAVSVMGMTCYGPGSPSEEEKAAYMDAMGRVVPGMAEEDFLALFEEVGTETRKIGLLDADQYQAEGYISRSYWIGYLYAGSYLQTIRVASVTCTNGAVNSIFYP